MRQRHAASQLSTKKAPRTLALFYFQSFGCRMFSTRPVLGQVLKEDMLQFTRLAPGDILKKTCSAQVGDTVMVMHQLII